MTDIEARRMKMESLAQRIHSAATDLRDFSRMHDGLPAAARMELRSAQIQMRYAMANIDELLANDPVLDAARAVDEHVRKLAKRDGQTI